MSGTSSCFFCKNVDFKKLTQYWGIGHTSSLLQPFFCDIQTENCLRGEYYKHYTLRLRVTKASLF